MSPLRTKQGLVVLLKCEYIPRHDYSRFYCMVGRVVGFLALSNPLLNIYSSPSEVTLGSS